MNDPQQPPTSGETLGPPVTHVGVLGWLRANLFNTWYNALLTLLVFYVLWKLVPPLFTWAFLDSRWSGPSQVCQGINGACWSFIPANLRFIIFGFFPEGQLWRPIVAIFLLMALVFYSGDRRHWKKSLAWLWLVGVFVLWLLMHGGLFGLPVVETTKWSGLPLTLALALVGIAGAYPLGVLLALGRRSRLPAIKTLCVLYIEIIRGVPLISMLFMSAVMFPLFLPEGVTLDKVLRAQIAIVMFAAAYIAEVVRGGLQAMPRGQYEAAESLGLNYTQTMRLIILPQALKIVIPPSVGILISAFKDTSLVVIIGLYDVLKTTKVALANPKWTGYSTEAYIFLAALYFMFCYAMSRYSRKLEKELHTGR
jgi:general L-amino acid transport system permease protein